MAQYIVKCERLKTADGKLYDRGETVTLTGDEEKTALRIGAVEAAPGVTAPATPAAPAAAPAAPATPATSSSSQSAPTAQTSAQSSGTDAK